MKRSDALGIIFNELQTTRRNDEVAVFILDKLEEAGMLPPSYEGLMKDGSKFIKGKNEGDAVMVINKWEPEDD